MALEALEIFLRVLLAGVAGVLAALTLIAYGRVRSGKLLLVGLGFVAFLVKGILMVAGIFNASAYSAFPASPAVLLLDVFVVSLLYAGTVKG